MSDVALTDGGLETALVFQQGLELPEFAAFPLLESEEGRRARRRRPWRLARRYRALADRLPGLRVVGGCCGTDHRHVRAISDALGAP